MRDIIYLLVVNIKKNSFYDSAERDEYFICV